MKRELYLTKLEAIFKSGMDIIRAKSSDYASADDSFRNFRMSEAINIKPEVGILIRMQDKMARVGNLLFGHNRSDAERLIPLLTKIRAEASNAKALGAGNPASLAAIDEILQLLGTALDQTPTAPAVKDESIYDTLVDLINYAAILIVWLENRASQSSNLEK